MGFYTITANAQFKATKDGVVTEDGQPYYIAVINGKTAQELYNSANSYVMNNFKNPNIVTSKQENAMLNIHGVFGDAYVCKKFLGIATYPNVDMNIIMYFKDGKVRFDPPVINSMYIGGGQNEVKFSGGVRVLGSGDLNMFKKNGNPNDTFLINNFNSFLNGKINDIIQYMKGQSNTNW